MVWRHPVINIQLLGLRIFSLICALHLYIYMSWENDWIAYQTIYINISGIYDQGVSRRSQRSHMGGIEPRAGDLYMFHTYTEIFTYIYIVI